MGKSLAVLGLVFVLAGCIGDQRNRQQFDGGAGVPWAARPPAPAGTRAEIVPLEFPPEHRQPSAGEGGSWRVPDTVANGGGATMTPGIASADIVTRSEMQASQNATQNSITGLGVQLGKVGERVEGVHAELSNRIDNAVTVNAQFRAELSATLNQQATIHAKAEADLRAEFNAKLSALAAANAQLAGQVAAGINNRTESTQSTSTAGRDSNQISFTPAMAEMFTRMMDKFCEMTRSEMHTLAYTITAISAAYAGIITSLAGLVVHKVGKRHNAVIDHILGAPAAEAKKITARLPRVPA